MATTIGNPGSWVLDQAGAVGRHLGTAIGHVGTGHTHGAALPQVRHLEIEDIRGALREGIDDFAACRTDVAFLVALYPIIGILMIWMALDRNLLPLMFPTMSGFALIGPVAAVGLYEMSRRRELGEEARWGHAFAVARSPSFGAILTLGLMLFAVFIVWILAANGIYYATLGPAYPESLGAFVREVLTTGAGWAMVLIGCAVGFLFAALVLATSVVSFPLLLDRDVGLPVAVITSMRVAAANPVPILLWGLIVAAGLLVGSVPLFLGLIVVLPVLGHATWHLYRRAVVAEPRPVAGAMNGVSSPA